MDRIIQGILVRRAFPLRDGGLTDLTWFSSAPITLHPAPGINELRLRGGYASFGEPAGPVLYDTAKQFRRLIRRFSIGPRQVAAL